MSIAQLRQNICNDIRQHGRSVLCVGGEDDSPSLAYTIGNWPKLPELLIIGTPKGGVLNELSDIMIRQGRAFVDGEIVDLGGKLPVKVIVADQRAKDDYTIQAGQYHKSEDYTVLQVLIPDKQGRFPDQPGCREPFAGFPVLCEIREDE